jgi:hypothetical protein
VIHHIATSQGADGVGSLGLELQPLVHVDDVVGDDDLGHGFSFVGPRKGVQRRLF